MKPIFLSYKREDLDDVREIAKILIAGGIRTWQDINSLGTGLTEPQIHKAIWEECSSLLFYATPKSITSDFIREVELQEAYRKHLQDPTYSIVPIFGLPIEKVNNALRQFVEGDISRFNGAKIQGDDGLLQASLEARAILLRNILKSGAGQDVDIAISTYSRTAGQLKPQLDLDWSRLYAPAKLFTQHTWETSIRPALLDVKDALSAAGRTSLRICPKAHLSAGFAFGFIFKKVTGFALDIEQYDQWWSTRDQPATNSLLETNFRPGTVGSKNLAISLSISRDIGSGIGVFMAETGTAFRAILDMRPTAGVSMTAVPDGPSALLMAKEIADAIRKAIFELSTTDIHIFAAIPLALAFLIGSELNACGQIHLYEYYKQESKYRLSWVVDVVD